MKKAIISLAVVLIILSGSYTAKSQYNMNYTLTGGLAIMNIIGNNPAKLPFVNEEWLSNGEYKYTYGGSFQETQSGFDVNFRIPLDDADKLRVPIGLEYIFFRSKEIEHVISNEESHDFLVENRFDLITVYSGMHYVMLKYPDYDINVYTGLEVRGTYLAFNDFKGTEIFKDSPDKVYNLNDKSPAFRIGTCLKFGGEGRLYKNMHANWFFALTALNLIGTNKSRGEFLTPQRRLESGESTVFTYQIGFQLQYKFVK